LTRSAHEEQVLVQIGEISCTQNWMVTPSGTVPLRGVQFQVPRENVTRHKRIPPVAIVLAIAFAIFCLIGLLFLLIQEEVVSGSIEVTATSPNGFTFQTSVPVQDQAGVIDVRNRVDYARRLVTQLR
jgi:hypothetical protein